MSSEITAARAQKYASDVYILAQQKGSRLRNAVRVEEGIVGKRAFFDRVGTKTAQLLTSRHADTTYVDTPHTRRAVDLAPYFDADLIDTADKVRMVWDPTGPYVQASMNALGRSMDDVILTAASADAVTGETGSGTTALGDAQKVMAVSGGAIANLNVLALRQAKKILDTAEVDPSISRHCAINAVQQFGLLGQTEVTSADYNTVRALVMGEVNTYLGFNFIHSERLIDQSGAEVFDTTSGLTTGDDALDSDGHDRVIAWAKDGLLLGIAENMVGKVDVLPGKHYSVQVYARMDLGAVRMEEAKVVEIHCKET